MKLERINENQIKLWKYHTVGFGEKSVQKLLDAIEKSRSITLDRFIYSLSIPLIGRSASKDIAKVCEYDVDKFKVIVDLKSCESFMSIDGFGEEMKKSLNGWWDKNKYDFCSLAREFTFEKDENSSTNADLSSKTFVITGSLMHYKNRDELVSVIERLDGKVSGSVSSKTSYLINNDKESPSSKNKKAKSLNIPIISEEEFIKMIQ